MPADFDRVMSILHQKQWKYRLSVHEGVPEWKMLYIYVPGPKLMVLTFTENRETSGYLSEFLDIAAADSP